MIEAKHTKTAIVASIVGSLVLTTGNALWGANLTQGDYTYTTNAAGQATITGFNKDYTGALALTNTLDGCPVTSIGDGTFYGCRNLTSVTIGNNVTSIGGGAFSDCASLTNVIIGSGVTTIGGSAFSDCRGLTGVMIPTNVIYIGQGAFHGCSSLTNVTIPASVRNIENDAFSDCTGLTSITIPDSVASIGAVAFMGCTSLTNVMIGNSVTNIEAGTFQSCTGLASIAIPDGVISIGTCAFSGCSGLNNVRIGKGVASIGGYAFHSCSNLTSVTIPDRVTRIGDHAFSGCTRLTNVTIPASVTSIGKSAFPSCSGVTNLTISASQTRVPPMPAGTPHVGSLPTPVAITGYHLDLKFSNCPADMVLREYSQMTGLTLLCSPLTPRVPITLVGYSNLSNDEYCGMIETALRDKGIRLVRTGDAFAKVVPLPADQEAQGMEHLTPATVTVDGTGAVSRLEFDCVPVETALQWYASTAGRPMSVAKDLPKTNISLHSPRELTAQECLQAIDNILLLHGITLIVLDGGGLGAILVATPESERSQAIAALPPLSNATDRSLSVPTPATVSSVPDGSMSVGRRVPRPLVPRSGGHASAFVSLGDYTYSTNAASQATITRFDRNYTGALAIPDILDVYPVTSITPLAFSGCTRLTSVTIPDTVTSIGDWAFKSCTKLTDVTIPDSVTNIGAGAFGDCSSLKTIMVDTNNPAYSSVDGVLFDKNQTTLIIRCPGAKAGALTIPSSVSSIWDNAFNACSALTSVTIPASVIQIGNRALSGCTNLTGVYFKGNAPRLDSSIPNRIRIRTPLLGISSATVYYLPGTTGWGETFGGCPTAVWNLDVSDRAESAPRELTQ